MRRFSGSAVRCANILCSILEWLFHSAPCSVEWKLWASDHWSKAGSGEEASMHALRRHIALAACAGGLVLVGFGGEPSKAGDAFRPASIAVTVNTESVGGRSIGTASACDTGNWHWRNPFAQGNCRRGVWGSEASDVWAVGDYGTIQHWDGSAWTSAWSGTTDRLCVVWGNSADDSGGRGQLGTIKHW